MDLTAKDMELVKQVEEWIDEEGCLSYAGLCRWAREKPELHMAVVANKEHFDMYIEALFEDVVAEMEDAAAGQ